MIRVARPKDREVERSQSPKEDRVAKEKEAHNQTAETLTAKHATEKAEMESAHTAEVEGLKEKGEGFRALWEEEKQARQDQQADTAEMLETKQIAVAGHQEHRSQSAMKAMARWLRPDHVRLLRHVPVVIQ